MKIDKDHLYYGAALLQVAEDSRYTSINCFREGGNVVRCAYVVNDETGLFLKYKTAAASGFKYPATNNKKLDGNEYHFQFTAANLAALERLAVRKNKTVIGLVCVDDKQIYALKYDELKALQNHRTRMGDVPGGVLTVYVALLKGSGFQVFVPEKGRRGSMCGRINVKRQDFPGRVF